MSKLTIIFLILLGITVILSVFGWQSLKGFLFENSNGAEIFLVAVMFLLVMAVFGIVILLFDSWKMLIGAAGVILLEYIFIFGFHWLYLAVFVVGLGFVLTGIVESRKEKNAHIKILPTQIAKPAQRALFTALAIAVSVVIYFSPPAQDLKTEIKIPRPLFDVIINSMTGFFDNQLQGLLVNPAGLAISVMPQISSKDIQNVIGVNELSLEQILKPEDRDGLYQTLNQQMNFFIQPYKKYLPYGLAVAIFFSLKAIGFIFVLLAGPLTKVMFFILKSFKVVKIGKEMVEKETIEV